jgi:hypothetical protein
MSAEVTLWVGSVFWSPPSARNFPFNTMPWPGSRAAQPAILWGMFSFSAEIKWLQNAAYTLFLSETL